ncbi:MAG: hypothetical protein KJZ69_16000 [Phycisphaerales bacterium]|nr:hypothetical protein [Phycisphaerales bacterium]
MAKSRTPTRSAASPPERGAAQTIEITAAAQIDIEAAAGEGQTALPRFKMIAYTGSAMRVAAWRHPVILDLAGLNIPSQMRPIRFSHDPASGVGHTDAIRIEQGQLIASGLVSRDTATAREIVTSSKNGFPWQASVGASVEEFEFIREGQKVLVNGQEFAGPVNVVRKATLGEISFVDLGADGKTSVNVAAIAANQENNMDGDTKDNENGTSVPATNGVVSQATVESAPTTDGTSKDDTKAKAIEDIRAQALAETSRIATIRRLCAGQHLDIEAQAIREGWDATRTELEILRANRPKAPAIHVPDQSVSTQILEAACLIAARFEDLEKHCEERSLDLAAKRFRGGIGLQELLLEAAWANGYTGRNFRDSRNVLKFAFNPGIEAGLSTIDIGGILSNVANKFLLEGFFSVERTWRNITAVRNVSDFKTVTSYRLIGKDQYEVVAPGGELKHGSLGEEQYTNKADTYGLLLSIDRRDIINDDLGAITTVPRKLGRGSGLKINDVFWTIFMANSDFFKVGNKNFLSGADTVLSIDGLTKAEVAFMDQVDGDGKPLGMLPAILLVPTALSAIGSQLFKSMELRDTTASTKYPVSNPHQGKFRVEVSRYLGNAQYTGNSAKAWYLLAEAADLPVIEVAFLNGQESPTIETAEADFNVLGIQMRGYHDFGCALQDPRGGVRSKGEA